MTAQGVQQKPQRADVERLEVHLQIGTTNCRNRRHAPKLDSRRDCD